MSESNESVLTGVGVFNVPAHELHEHPKNIRRHFAEEPLAEMEASIRASGIWQPLMVWPRLDGGGYLILAGHRRFRAGKRAGLETFPCLVRDCGEAAALEILTFENLQRADVHPLEEAAGFRVYIDETLADVAAVSAKSGKSQSYVYGRLKLLDAIPEAQQLCWDRVITANHLERIARRTPADQMKAVRHCTPPDWDFDRRVSVRELADWMAKNLDLNLLAAPFPLDSADLVAEAGSCTACPHRVGNLPDFDPSQDVPDACTRRECYEQKVAAFVEIERVRLTRELPELLLVSEFPNIREKLAGVLYSGWSETLSPTMGQLALVVEGPRAGRAIRVIVEKRHAPPKPSPTPDQEATQLPSATRPRKKSTKEIAAEQERQRLEKEELERQRKEAEQARQEREKQMRRERAIRKRLLVEVLAKVAWPPRREDVLAILDPEWLADLPRDLDDLVQAHGVPPGSRFLDASRITDEGAAKLIVLVACSDDFGDLALGGGCERLNAVASRYSVNVEAIRKQALAAEGGTRKAVIRKLPTLNSGAKKAAAKKKAAPVAKKAAPKTTAKKGAPKKAKGKK